MRGGGALPFAGLAHGAVELLEPLAAPAAAPNEHPKSTQLTLPASWTLVSHWTQAAPEHADTRGMVEWTMALSRYNEDVAEDQEVEAELGAGVLRKEAAHQTPTCRHRR